MNPIVFLISFLPWILFGLFAGHSLVELETALFVSLVISVIVGYRDMRDKLIVPWVTFSFFVGMVIALIVLQWYSIIPYIGIASNIVLTGIAFGSLAIGIPFTIQYAKRDVPRERWENPVFIEINKVLTAFWGILFFLGLLQSVYKFYYPNSLGLFGEAYMWISIIVGIVFTMKYPAYAKKRSQT
ncbi:hypothetical protein [Methanospirillum hungatei]|uniref:hypothetical protein n=1 Tax=Methanospirillum hungatei TaxID=2203 RepID=UPI001B64DEFB|nr:hypothetical protein [Methanospirillum hungatei]MBP9009509.1 hypothetical protein [Methanospirillum sp.]HOW03760.1 hypothetical protein [Methanospirillum hungatei]